MKEVYLDNNATTMVAPEVVDVMTSCLSGHYGNASSVHIKGVEAERILKNARQMVSRLLKVPEKSIVFTSGGTESNNTIIKGLAEARKKQGRHIITTAIEHASVLGVMKQLEEQGFSITRLDPNEQGIVEPGQVLDAVTDETILVSVMHINNETGAIFPVEEIGAALKKNHPNIVIHTDAVQGFGKRFIDLTHIDAYSFSGHKIHAPKGVGGFYLNPDIHQVPLLVGGGQERGQRSGTENIPGIAALSKAAELMVDSHNEVSKRLASLKKYFLNELQERFNLRVNSPGQGIFNTLNVSFPPIPGEVIVNALSEKGICVSTGSACSSGKQQKSHVLQAMKLSYEALNSSIRFSFSRFTTKNELEYTLQVLEETLPRLIKVAELQRT